jgi:hypothetical protein
MKKFKNIISKILVLIMVLTMALGTFPENVLAANIKIRQEINIIDGYMGAASGSYATSSEIININTTKYTSATYYFEVVASTSASLASNIYLKRTTGATVATAVIPTLTTSYTRIRSSSFSPTAGSNDYQIVIGNEAGATKGAIAARVVILQDAVSLDNTETQIEIGNNETYSSTTLSPLGSPKYWYYDSSKWDGSKTFYAEATYGRVTDATGASSTAYSAAGTYTQIIPADVSGSVVVELWGGGGGGGAASTNTSGSGSGGAGGQYAKKTISGLAGTSKTLVVGSFGAGGNSTAAGSAGGDSTWDTNVVVAKGGAGGAANSGTAGAGSATGGVGDTVNAGGSGRAGVSGGASGGGGGGAGSTGVGGSAGVAPAAGTGTANGGGDGGTGTTANATPAAASAAGGGGAGGRSTGSANVNGGNGAIGGATVTFNTGISATTTIVLQQDDGSFANWTDKVTIVDAGNAGNPTRVRSSSFTPTSGRNYRIAVKEGYSGAVHAIYNAKIIIDQATGTGLSGATYDSISFSAASQTATTHGVDFKPDGTKMYVVARTGTFVFQYSLSTPWDVSTASYDSKSFTQSLDGTGSDIHFKSDGTKMYFIGRNTDFVYQYTLSTPWDVSTASYDSVSFSVGTQSTLPWSLYLTDDGTRMYVNDDATDVIYQYTLGTAWDMSTASYASKSFSHASQDTTPTGHMLSSDGLSLYVGGGVNDDVYKYTLSTAWDISTASYSSESFSMSAENTDLHNIYISPDLTHMYGIHNANDTVYQYSMSSGPITKLEPQYQVANTKLSSGTSIQNFKTLWDSSEWGTTNVYKHEANSVSAGTSDVKLQDTTGPADITGSTITDIVQREQSSSITMPTSGRDIGVTATTNNNDIYSSRIIVQVDTAAPASIPTVTTQAASSISAISATLNGNITDTGGSSPTVRGFAYGTSATLATVIATTTENGTFSTGAFTGSASSLTCNTTYYARPYATNTTGTGYGTIISFVTSACAPTVTTQSASSVGQTSATLNGNITATGGADATVRGFAWGTSSSMVGDTATTTENGTFSTGAFTDSSLTLVCNTTYYSRAYATNSAGTSYGSISASFTTSACSTSLSQLHYRWRNDFGSESGAGYATAEDTAITSGVELGDRIRLRFLINDTANSATGYTYRLETASSSCSAWMQVASSTTGNPHWIMDTSSKVADGEATTDSSGLTNPAGTFVPGYVMTQDSQTPAHSLTSGQFTELEYSIRSTANLSTNTVYCFRLTNAGVTTGFTFSQQPQITIPPIGTVRPKGGGGGNAGGESSGSGPIVPGGSNGGGSSTDGSGGGQNTGGGGNSGGGGDTGYIWNLRIFALLRNLFFITDSKFSFDYLIKIK